MKKQQTHNLSFILTCFLIAIGVVYLVWASVIDGRLVRVPVVIYDQPNGYQIQTNKMSYEQGETVYGTIKYCKNRNMPVSYQWSLINTYLKLFPEKTSNVPTGCHEVLTMIEEIPHDQYPDSDLYFETVLRYKLNEFNTIEIPIRTNTFRVK